MKKFSFIGGLFWGFLGSVWTGIIFLAGMIVGVGLMGDVRKKVRKTYRTDYSRPGRNCDWTNVNRLYRDEKNDDDE